MTLQLKACRANRQPRCVLLYMPHVCMLWLIEICFLRTDRNQMHLSTTQHTQVLQSLLPFRNKKKFWNEKENYILNSSVLFQLPLVLHRRSSWKYRSVIRLCSRRPYFNTANQILQKKKSIFFAFYHKQGRQSQRWARRQPATQQKSRRLTTTTTRIRFLLNSPHPTQTWTHLALHLRSFDKPNVHQVEENRNQFAIQIILKFNFNICHCNAIMTGCS